MAFDQSKYNQKYSRSKNGLIARTHKAQRERTAERKYPPVEYSLQELKDWCLKDPKFHLLYDDWVLSGFRLNKRPSLDRIDDYLGYSFSNIVLKTRKENIDRSYEDMKNGINTKTCKAVIRIDESGNEVEYYSIKNASRLNNVNYTGISKCCQGKRKISGGYLWRYK